MVDWSILTKASKYVGLEIIAIISFILTIQEVFKIELNLDFIVYVLIIAAFIDGLIKLSLNTIHRITISLALDSKMKSEYTIEQLQAELKKDKSAQEEALEAAKNAKQIIDEKKTESLEKKIADLEAQL